MLRIAILAEFPISALTGGAVGRGGGQGCTWLPQLALAFQEYKDLEIHWVILDRTIRRRVVVEALGQYFHRVPAVKFSLDLALNYLPARFVLGREIKRIKPDIVHAWGTETINPAALSDWNGPSILSMQGILAALHSRGLLENDWRWRKMIASEPQHLRNATIVTVESVWGMEQLRKINLNLDIRQVEYGVHPEFLNTQWKPKHDDPRILYVGGIGYGKGLDIFLNALQLAKSEWNIRLAGHSDMAKMARNCGLKNFESLGLIPWDLLRSELSLAWCLVLPTRGDTSPNVVKEARAVGLPVITSIHGGQTDYVINQINGRIVEPLNAENLASALADVMSSHGRAVALGRGRHEDDRRHLDPKRTAKEFAAIYCELRTKK
jgi:glycosyltransferase involved in cell wall biosynthesis